MTPYMPQPVVNFEIVDHEVLKKQDYVVSTRMQNLQKDGYVVNASNVCHTFWRRGARSSAKISTHSTPRKKLFLGKGDGNSIICGG